MGNVSDLCKTVEIPTGHVSPQCNGVRGNPNLDLSQKDGAARQSVSRPADSTPATRLVLCNNHIVEVLLVCTFMYCPFIEPCSVFMFDTFQQITTWANWSPFCKQHFPVVFVIERFVFWFSFHWYLFPMAPLTILTRHWFGWVSTE